MRTIAETVTKLPNYGAMPKCPRPEYLGDDPRGVGLTVQSLARHTTDEGNQLFLGLQHAGYDLAGRGFKYGRNVETICSLNRHGVYVVQDKREWTGKTAGPGFNPQEALVNVSHLAVRPNLFKLTVLKDAHNDQQLHRQSAVEMGCHGWIIYYHSDIVCRLAPYVRREHLIRTHHSLDATLVPDYRSSLSSRRGTLLSGAVSNAYPLRARLFRDAAKLPEAVALKHPGYGRTHCHTPDYLKELSKYKVAICTSSIYGYVLRKIAEATACGCVVVTDLPTDEVVPEIDGNLVRIGTDAPLHEVSRLLLDLYRQYDPQVQERYAELAKLRFDYRETGRRLAEDIEQLRGTYNGGAKP